MHKLIFNKTVAIIGSSGELDCNDYSKMIKNVDVIVRINVRIKNNELYLPASVIKNTHIRTDIIYHSGVKLGEGWTGTKNNTIYANNNYSLSVSYINACKKVKVKAIVIAEVGRFKSSKKFETSNINIFSLNDNKLKIRSLTSGIKCIYDILQYSPAHVYIIGFDCHLSPNGQSWYNNYQNVAKLNVKDIGNGVHDMIVDLETLYDIYMKNKNIVTVTQHLKDTWKHNNIK